MLRQYLNDSIVKTSNSFSPISQFSTCMIDSQSPTSVTKLFYTVFLILYEVDELTLYILKVCKLESTIDLFKIKRTLENPEIMT